MRHILMVAVYVLVVSEVCRADDFGWGLDEFTIDFVTIAGDASSANGTAIGDGKMFSDPGGEYRMGMYEISNEQWIKYENNIFSGPYDAQGAGFFFLDPDDPVNEVSWYEAAEFVNWLNTSTGHQAAYKTDGTTGSFVPWGPGDSGYDAGNPFRNRDAVYVLPAEDEWVKAGYWNGATLQTYATIGGGVPVAQVDSNYNSLEIYGLWNVGDGNEELNGTFDMMGNVYEWLENPYLDGNFGAASQRALRGGSSGELAGCLACSFRSGWEPDQMSTCVGFRVASIPEPCGLVLLAVGGLALLRKRKV